MSAWVRTAAGASKSSGSGRAVGVGLGAYRYKVPQRAPRRDPDAARLAEWYHARNPGQADGDCLAMIVPLDLAQLTRIARRAAVGW